MTIERDNRPETRMFTDPYENPDYIFIDAKRHVIDYVQKEDGVDLDFNDVYIVWFSKTLQNWKALVSTDLKDNRYYELTHNGDKGETYLDVYVKTHNEAIPLF